MVFIPQGSQRRTLGEEIQRVGVEGILDPLQPLYQHSAAHGHPHPQAGQRPRLGQGLHHQQVVVVTDQGRGRLAPKIDIGLVNYHHRFAVRLK